MKQTTIGLLFPSSSVYPGIGYDVMEGFRAALEHYECDAKLVAESAGIGGIEKDVQKAAEKLLMQESADVLVGYVDHMAAEKLDAICNAANKILIVIEPGGVIPTSWTASPLRFHVTLDAALGSRAVGHLAGLEGMKKGIFATSFYDAGYLNCSAYVDAYASHGGEICYNFVAPFKHEEFDITHIVNAVSNVEADAILAQLSIETGKLFLEEYAKTDKAESVKFYASPFLMEESFLDTVRFPFAGIKGVVPWSRHLDNDTNKKFLETIAERGRTGNSFSALAWDAAQLAIKAISALREHNNNGQKAAQALVGTTIHGTRGTMQHDADTNYFPGPLYNAEVVNEDGASKLELGAEITYGKELWETHKSKPIGDAHSRWVNTYLCTT